MELISNLIIGGVTRAATTSLFKYLSDHPHICPSSYKETRFFLDREYPLPRLHYFDEGLEKYNEFFIHCMEGTVRLAAEPDYLYSPGTAKRIRDSLPGVRLVFILREPISRLVSWHRFARQNGFLAPNVSFKEYIDLQLHRLPSNQPPPQYLRALEQGHYSHYLQRYFQVFDRNQILVVQFEVLQRVPCPLVQGICRLIHVDPSFYDDYHFEIYNRSVELRNTTMQRLYHELTRRLRTRVHNRPALRKVLRNIRDALEPFYLRLNLCPTEQVDIPPHLKVFLEEYYGGEPEAIADLLMLSSWSWQQPLLPGNQESRL